MHQSLRSSSMTHGESRQQSRQSPLYLISAGRDVIGGRRFELDPASNSKSIVDAHIECWYGGRPGQSPGVLHRSSSTRIRRLFGDGLEFDWLCARHIFINPPWGNMGPFIARAMEFAEAMRRAGETDWSIQMLVPLRPHRNYWAPAYSADAWCLLKPVRFVGFDEQMPTPCAWLYWGSDVKAFRSVFHLKQGVVLTDLPKVSSLTQMLPSKNEEKEPMVRLLELSLRGQGPEDLANVLGSCSDASAAELMRLAQACDGQAFEELVVNAVRIVLERTAVSSSSDGYALWTEEHKLQGPPPKNSITEVRARVRAGMNATKTTAKKTAGKKAAKKSTAKKAPKKAPAKRTRAAGKKAAKKSTSKTSSPKTPPKKAPKLNGGSAARVGTKVRRMGTETEGVIRAIEGTCAQVEWTASGVTVKVIASDLEKVPAKKSDGGKVAKLLQAIETEILAGRTTEFSCREVSTAMNVSVSTATRALNQLIEAGKCQKVGTGRKSAYASLVPAEDDRTVAPATPANDSGAGAA